MSFFLFQAEDGIRVLVRSRGLGDVYKRQDQGAQPWKMWFIMPVPRVSVRNCERNPMRPRAGICLLYTSDAADERSSVDLGGRRIIKKKNI